GQSSIDLSGLTALVIDHLKESPEPSVAETVTQPTEGPPPPPEPPSPTPADLLGRPGVVCLTLFFEANLPWPDMKAKLVLNRLASKGRVLKTEPPVGKLEESVPLRKFTVWLAADCEIDELQAMADVDGVSEIRFETAPRINARVEPPTEPASVHVPAA